MHQWYTKLINVILDFTYFYDTVCLTSNVIRKDKMYEKKNDRKKLKHFSLKEYIRKKV